MFQNKTMVLLSWLLIAGVFTSSPNAVAGSNPWGIQVGVIRWDAWYGDPYASPRVTRSLSPKMFWKRIPFFGQIESDMLLPINGNSSQVMAQELEYARAGGIDYWAFLDYPINSGLDNGIKLYMAEPNNRDVKFSLIFNNWSAQQALNEQQRDNWFNTTVSRILDYRYETVLDGRPLIYVYSDICSPDHPKTCSSKLFNDLNNIILNKKGVLPYYVYLTSDFEKGQYEMKKLGMHAVSSYAALPIALGSKTNLSYNEYRMRVRLQYNPQLKQFARSYGFDVVPFASAGWNPTPRFYCVNECFGNLYGENKQIVIGGKPNQIAKHIKSVAVLADKWSKKPKTGRIISPARTMLIYAWNEFDEGGWLSPTLNPETGGPDTSRIEALRTVLRPNGY